MKGGWSLEGGGQATNQTGAIAPPGVPGLTAIISRNYDSMGSNNEKGRPKGEFWNLFRRQNDLARGGSRSTDTDRSRSGTPTTRTRLLAHRSIQFSKVLVDRWGRKRVLAPWALDDRSLCRRRALRG